MLALAGVPGIYVHSLFGSHNDQAGYERSGWKRDLNHERLSLAEIEGRLVDPASEAARVFDGYRRLLEVRRAQSAFHPAAPQAILDLGPGLFALRRGRRDGQTIVALHNVTARSQELPGEKVYGLSRPSCATIAPIRELISDAPIDTDATLILPPYGVAWIAYGW
jgi:sucrose phosphorylase